MINLDLDMIFSIRNIVIYFVVINVIAFFAMGIDKWKAKRDAWRIPEATLFTLVLLGGGIGGILGMYTFHHKTKKTKFKVGFPFITIIEFGVIIYFAFFR